MDNRYKTSAGCVFVIKYHFVWCPKYRRKVLNGALANRLKVLLHDICNENEWLIDALEIMPDHVHCFISAHPVDSPQFIANQLKGTTSRILREEFPLLKSRLPSLWSRSYYVGTVGIASKIAVQKYIEAQKGK